MIFLVQFGTNTCKHLQIFQRLQIALALRARAIFVVFEKFACAYLFQIALENIWLPVLINFNYTYVLAWATRIGTGPKLG